MTAVIKWFWDDELYRPKDSDRMWIRCGECEEEFDMGEMLSDEPTILKSQRQGLWGDDPTDVHIYEVLDYCKSCAAQFNPGAT